MVAKEERDPGGAWTQLVDRRGRYKRLTMARMARFPTRFPARGGTLARLLVRRV